MGNCPLALKVSVGRARAAKRTMARVWAVPTHAAAADPEDYDDEDPRIYAPRVEEAAGGGPDLVDFRDYGGPRDSAAVYAAVSADGFPGAESPSELSPARMEKVLAAGRCAGFSPRSGGRVGSINPYAANAGHRFQISLAIQTIQGGVSGRPNYKPIRLLAECVAGTGKSFVIHDL